MQVWVSRLHKGAIPKVNGQGLWLAWRHPMPACRALPCLAKAAVSWPAGLPSAMAAKLVKPDKAVMAVVGDGGFLMHSQVQFKKF